MNTAIPLGSAVYVRYKDHLLYKNIPTPVEDAVERETIGWLTKQNNELILIEHDRTYPYEKLPTGSGSGLIILKSCLIEIHKLPLQNIPSGSINRSNTKEKRLSMRLRQRSEKLSQSKTATEPKSQCKQ